MIVANVFGLPLNSLILPAAIAKSREATKLYKRYMAVSEQYVAAAKELDDIRDKLRGLIGEGFEEEVLAALDVGETFEAGDRRRDIAIAALMFDLTGEPEWDRRADEIADEFVAQRRAQEGRRTDGQHQEARQRPVAGPLPRRGRQGARAALRPEGRRAALARPGDGLRGPRRLRGPEGGQGHAGGYAASWEAVQVSSDGTRRIVDNALRLHLLPALGAQPIAASGRR